MKISVIVCTRDRPDTIGQALDSILSCDYPEFDLHVMDQSTADRTRRIVEELAVRDGGRLRYHHLAKAGLSRAYNAGIEASDGDIIALTDDDCVLPADWLASISSSFQRHPDVELLYGQVLIPESLAYEVARGVVVPALPIPEERKIGGGAPFEVFGMGANMAVKRTLIRRMGGFDEALGGGGPLRSSQDSDFGYRAFRAGAAILLAPDVRADHYGTRMPDQWPDTLRNYGIGDGAFYSKHIRCGDLLAMRLLAMRLLRSAAWELKHSFSERRRVRDLYGRNLLNGVKAGARFGVDKERRLYRETERGRMISTQANAVTPVQRQA